MKWSLQQLYKAGQAGVTFDETVEITDFIGSIDDILGASSFRVSGTGHYVYGDRYVFNIHIEGTLILECALTLEEVPYQVVIDTVEVFDKIVDEEVNYIEKNTIDLLPIVWENILVEKPMKVTKY